ncbi:hypothetical protein CEXT_203711 [Caerostris extrusa]|uniref:Uncharacterized protein n=1 Tax=Caerostris extrusa TaxID=172846 RepID=A0AAV4Y2B6_CAEEX|nr:hypothetical protein CEXT_203711 [Caerostris extrusa]
MPKKRIRRDLDFDHNVGSRGHVQIVPGHYFYCSFFPFIFLPGRTTQRRISIKKKYLSDQNVFFRINANSTHSNMDQSFCICILRPSARFVSE